MPKNKVCIPVDLDCKRKSFVLRPGAVGLLGSRTETRETRLRCQIIWIEAHEAL